MARISGKLTAKSLGWDRNAIGTAVKKVPADGGRVFIGRIVGNVTGLHQSMNDETGEVQTGLKGNFRGISSLNEFVPETNAKGEPKKDAKGETIMKDSGAPVTMTAGRCYLPGGIQDMIEGAYADANKGDDKGNSVSFAVDLYAIPATNKAGYSYDADTVTEANQVDPLDLLLQSAAAIRAIPGTTAPALTDGTKS